MIADRRSQIAISSAIICDHMKTYFCDRLLNLRLRSQTIAEERTIFYFLRSSAIICDPMPCDQLRSCDCAIIRKPKFLRSAIETHPIIFQALSHDSTLVCSIVETVHVATLISLSSWLRLNMLVRRNLWRKLHVMNVFTIATAKILKTRTKRPTFGQKSGRSLIYRPGKRRTNFAR